VKEEYIKHALARFYDIKFGKLPDNISYKKEVKLHANKL